MPDRRGNNRLDGLSNLIDNPAIGLIFFLPGMNETLRLQGQAEIRDDADLLDAAMVFGTGFAPFRGGVLQYAADRGYKNIHKVLLALQDKHGHRFKPVDSEMW